MQADPAKLVPEHPARVHPEWVWAYGGKLYFDPGLPEAQEHIHRAILHAVEHYDLDGVHFDDYFYPYPVSGQTIPDAATFAAHGAGFDTVEAWRRHNVDTFVRTVSERIKAAKPWVKFGISPFGIWRNRTTDPLGSDTGGSQSYDLQFADTRRWVARGLARLHQPADLLAVRARRRRLREARARGGPTSPRHPARTSTSARRCTR